MSDDFNLPKRMIVADVGMVHDGSFGNACALVDMVVDAGANVVNFQTHFGSSETTLYAPQPQSLKGESQYRYFERTAFGDTQWTALKRRCDERGVVFLSSSFSEAAVDQLERIGAQIHKVPSGEVTNLFLLERLAATGKPIVLSSGMSSWIELDRAVDVLRQSPRLIVLQCCSVVPCSDKQVGINVMMEMAARYGCEVGLSDCTHGIAAGVAAATLGATLIEKHATFSRALHGGSLGHSMEPAQLREYCENLESVWAMLDNSVDKDNLTACAELKSTFQKSLVSAHDLYRGLVLGREHLAAKRPGSGISTFEIDKVLGRRLKFDILPDTLISWDMLE